MLVTPLLDCAAQSGEIGPAVDTARARRHGPFRFLFGWLAIVYGKLLVGLAGEAAQAQFVRVWAIGVGLNQVSDLQAFLITAGELALAATVLDALWLQPNHVWLERLVDYSSVQATTFLRGGGWRARIWASLRHGSAVQGS